MICRDMICAMKDDGETVEAYVHVFEPGIENEEKTHLCMILKRENIQAIAEVLGRELRPEKDGGLPEGETFMLSMPGCYVDHLYMGPNGRRNEQKPRL